MQKLILPVIVSLVILITGCCKEEIGCKSPSSLPAGLETMVVYPSMKGWELYSWQEKEKGCVRWNYVLVQGTGRLKSYTEITQSATMHLKGEQQLKLLLNRFPKNEHILWIGEKWLSEVWGQSHLDYGKLALPPVSFQNDILEHGRQLELEITVAP